MTYDDLVLRVRQARSEVDRERGRYESLVQELENTEKAIESLKSDIDVYEKVTALLNSLGETRQEKAQKVIEDMVTRGLQMVFDPTLSFHITQSVKGKQSIVDFTVRSTFKNQVIETPVLESRGGGLAATVGFLLRVVVLLLQSGTQKSNVLILDETFAHVSADRLDALGEFLRDLVDRTGIQIIMVTHQTEFLEYADKVYRFSQVDGKTKVSA